MTLAEKKRRLNRLNTLIDITNKILDPLFRAVNFVSIQKNELHTSSLGVSTPDIRMILDESVCHGYDAVSKLRVILYNFKKERDQIIRSFK